MSEQDGRGLRRVRRALLSVSDKTGLAEFARGLAGFGVELLSTGGTAAALRAAGLEVRDVSDVTGFPEMLDGRVKTLHPRVHGGLLALRGNAEHAAAMSEHGIEPIDMAVINLYPFERTVAREGVTLEEAVEQIDIGGPAMVRSAAKNWRDVAVVTSPEMYGPLLGEMSEHGGALSRDTRAQLALRAFTRTASYDRAIVSYLSEQIGRDALHTVAKLPAREADDSRPSGMPDSLELTLSKTSGLRYGENPHQLAALYATGEPGVAAASASM
jgi:phosphoribosylaminoimidazolecarboxamide formyltransferase / IMP cyclohydrolase